MLSKSFIELCKCRWREFRREPSAFFWVMFMPLLSMVILGLSFSHPSREITHVAMLAEQSQSHFGKTVISALQEQSDIQLQLLAPQDVERSFKNNSISVLIKLSQGTLDYQLDPTNPKALTAQRLVNDVIQEKFGRYDVIKSRVSEVRINAGRYIDFLVPGLLGLSIMTSSLFGVGMTLVSNRKENLLKRYLATPMRKSEFLASHIVGRLIVLTYEFAAVVIAGYLIFKFQVLGNFALFFAVAAYGAAMFTAMALLCASRTSSIPAMGGMVNLISLPMMLFSGVFFARNNFPIWMQDIMSYLPLSALVDALRKVALDAQPAAALYREFIVMGGYLIICAFAAQRRFRWY